MARGDGEAASHSPMATMWMSLCRAAYRDDGQMAMAGDERHVEFQPSAGLAANECPSPGAG